MVVGIVPRSGGGGGGGGIKDVAVVEAAVAYGNAFLRCRAKGKRDVSRFRGWNAYVVSAVRFVTKRIMRGALNRNSIVR